MKFSQTTLLAVVAAFALVEGNDIGRRQLRAHHQQQHDRELVTLHSSSDQKLVLFSGDQTKDVGQTNYGEADRFCREKGRVVANTKEWCRYAIQNPNDGYGIVPIRGARSEYMNVEDVCGDICKDDENLNGKVVTGTVHENAILCTKLVTKAPTIPKTCAIVYDDPHVTTFDGLKYDCHGPGDFILSKSLDRGGYQLQGRFYKKPRAGWPGSVTTAAVLNTGHPDEPTIEVGYVNNLAPRFQARMQYFINGDEVDVDANWAGDGTLAAGNKVQFFRSKNNNGYEVRNFFFPESGISFQITKRYHPMYYNFINVKLCLPDNIKRQKVVGVFGSPDGNERNDFMDRSGKTQDGIYNGWWGQKNDNCKATWCIGEGDRSFFKKPGNNGFCHASDSSELETAVLNASPELKAICGDDNACLVEGQAGGVERAQQFLKDQKEQDHDDGQIAPEQENDDTDMEDLKEVCNRKPDPKVPINPPTRTPNNNDCKIILGIRSEWNGNMKVGFTGRETEVDFTGTGLSLERVGFSSGSLQFQKSGQTLKITKMGWIKDNDSQPKPIQMSPVGGRNPNLATFTLPSCGSQPPPQTPEPSTARPTKSPTKPPTNVPTKTPTVSPSSSPSETASGTPTGTPTKTPTLSPSSPPSETASGTPTGSPSKTPTVSPSSPPSETASGTPTDTPTKTPTVSPSSPPSETASGTPTDTPTKTPTATPSSPPSETVSGTPTSSPSNPPTDDPTKPPTENPTTTKVPVTFSPSAPPSKEKPEEPKLPEKPTPKNPSTGSPKKPSTPKETAPPTEEKPKVSTPPKKSPPKKKEGGAFGDPHIMGWNGKQFDFHGGCDLVLLDTPEFMNNLGMRVNIRTKIRRSWSYIHSAVVRIGQDTLEVMGGESENNYWVNGEKGMEVQKPKADNNNVATTTTTIAGYKVEISWPYSKQRVFKLDLGENDFIIFKTFKDFVRVDIKIRNSHKLQNSHGLMGSYPSGAKLGRDHMTDMENDTDAFGQEWQVLANEDMLFHTVEGVVQAPMKCEMPNKSTKGRRRRLGETIISQEEAEKACASQIDDTGSFEACVFDVQATGDIDIAGAY